MDGMKETNPTKTDPGQALLSKSDGIQITPSRIDDQAITQFFEEGSHKSHTFKLPEGEFLGPVRKF